MLPCWPILNEKNEWFKMRKSERSRAMVIRWSFLLMCIFARKGYSFSCRCKFATSPCCNASNMAAVDGMASLLYSRRLLSCVVQRPNVCPYRDVDIVMTKKPCNKTYSRLVKVWRPNCGGRPNNWCLGYEQRSAADWLLNYANICSHLIRTLSLLFISRSRKRV